MSSDVIDIMVEIPKGSRNKYEYDHDNDVLRLDRRLFTATRYPSDYGFVPDTLSLDGDPLDVLVLLDDPTFPGCMVTVRVVGVFFMVDEAGPDAKLITVIHNDPDREHLRDINDIPAPLRDEIAHFFAIYKDLEPNKESSPGHYEDKAAALKELGECQARFQELPSH